MALHNGCWGASDTSPTTSSAAIFFPGSGYVACESGPTQWLANNFTIEAWIFPQAPAGVQRIVSDHGETKSGQMGFGFGLTGRKLRLTIFGVQDLDSPTEVASPSTWSHVAVVFDKTNQATFYVDGKAVGTVKGKGPAKPSDRKLEIGSNPGKDREWWRGKLAEIRFWNHPRTAEQIRSLMNSRLKGTEEGLVAYYPCGEGSGIRARDYSPNRCLATLLFRTSWTDGPPALPPLDLPPPSAPKQVTPSVVAAPVSPAVPAPTPIPTPASLVAALTPTPAAASGSVAPPASAPAASGLAWQQDFAQALAAASRERKPVLVYFHGADVPRCAHYDKKIFVDPSVQAALAQRFVSVRVPFLSSLELANKLQVFRAGTLVILDPNGTKREQITSALTPEEFVQRLKQNSGG